ncbi:MAG: hypothetical protein PUD03_08875 [Lachnospiraceae bacterium]|nr:hypothetical protein [Lachnospiraceae bacterium]
MRKLVDKNNYKKIKFVIVSTRQRWGGAIALHTLCKNLEELGYNASIYYINDGEAYTKRYFWIKHILFKLVDFIKKNYVKIYGETCLIRQDGFSGYVNISIRDCTQKHLPWLDANTIAVYPDVVYGNFLGAKNVVRWLLYYNRYSDDAYGTNDLFYAYREVFNDKRKNPENKILTVAYFDLDIYKQTNFGIRSGSCYVIRKGSDRIDLPKEFDGPIIDDLTEQDKVKILNESKYCISYYTQTAYSAIAAICGCISIVVPEEGKTWKDYRSTKEECYGVAFGKGKEQISWAKKTASKALERYQELNANGLRETDKFAKEAIKYFGLDR